MDTRNPVAVQRLEYKSSVWSISHTRLTFELDSVATRVTSELTLERHTANHGQSQSALTLQGVDCVLESVSIDGALLSPAQYQLTDTELHLTNVPERCVVSIVCIINPENNTALEGLYRSSGNFCTQCEAEGFRKITYYLDRPDVLSVFDVIIIADASQYPVMLSNGNCVSNEQLDNGLHRAHWHDPHPKPCYLFALVAGDLAHIEDHFVTASGRDVLLRIYVQEHNVERCDFAMESLKKSMRWDEEVYGFEYDLDIFMIVAVDDFNMGAMENKGLNVFNSRFVLADAQTATDTDFLGVEAVIAHEYFHNWTGNRITCRDWFQLSLKEGLTVFRDQSFSSDQHSETVKRIEDVRLLRARQFPEDAGPMAHPIRPDSYIEINNFYTLTVYEKGAEVIRMLHTLLGAQNWRRGIDVYVERHDGGATTCDAFIDAMQSITDIDLTQFRRWYSTAGTPELTISEHYDQEASQYHLTIKQHCPDTPQQSNKEPLHIPLAMGLLDGRGQSMPIALGRAYGDGVVLDVTEHEQTFVFNDIPEKPTASLLRGFSAPVKLRQSISDDSLAFLLVNDSDAFNRWEAGQRLGERVILSTLGDEGVPDKALLDLGNAFGTVLHDQSLEFSFKAEALSLPTLDTLAEAMELVDYHALATARDSVLVTLVTRYADALTELVVNGRQSDLPLLDAAAMGMRSLANTALGLLTYLPAPVWEPLALAQYERADNMTDRLAALACLCHGESAAREQCLKHFYIEATENRLVMDKWFAVQATARRPQIVDDVLALLKHTDFDVSNPNRLRSVVSNFATNNPLGFHAEDGRGYALLAEQIIMLDKVNPQVAARLVTPLGRWRRFVPRHQSKMRAQLERVMQSGKLSTDVYELVSKSIC